MENNPRDCQFCGEPLDCGKHPRTESGAYDVQGCQCVFLLRRNDELQSRLDEALKKLYELENIEKAHHEAIEESDFFADKVKEVEAERYALSLRLDNALKFIGVELKNDPIGEWDKGSTWACKKIQAILVENQRTISFEGNVADVPRYPTGPKVTGPE